MDIFINSTNSTDLPLVDSTDTTHNVGTMQLVVIMISVVVMILICGGNVIVILAISLTPELHEITNIFVVNLAVADTLFGLQNIPVILSQIRPDVVETSTFCHGRMWTIALAAMASIMTLAGKWMFL